VRRALLRSWPALTQFYGLFPWDVDRITFDELNEYIRQLSEQNFEQEMHQRRRNRGRR
jgi:hypothetical protein